MEYLNAIILYLYQLIPANPEADPLILPGNYQRQKVKKDNSVHARTGIEQINWKLQMRTYQATN
jgi:hypothetical protein